jgi:hypothetical protein
MYVRIYLSATKRDIADLLANGQVTLETGWTLTDELSSTLCAELETDDQEVLEDQLCQWAGLDGVAIVAIASATVLDADSGQIRPDAAIAHKQIQAVFVADQSDDLVWFGPTELESALAAAN